MQPDIALTLVEDFENGLLSRRQLASRLMGLGAALTVIPTAVAAPQREGGTFQATGLNHVALNVSKCTPVTRLLREASGAKGRQGRRRGQLLLRRW